MELLVIIVVLLVVGAIAAAMGAFDGPRRRVVRRAPVETTQVVPTRTVTTERTVVSDDTPRL